MSEKYFFVYMMASGKRGTIYIGVTSDLLSRVRQHKDHLFKNSFTDRYDVTTLVWYEASGMRSQRSGVRSNSRNGAVPGRSS